MNADLAETYLTSPLVAVTGLYQLGREDIDGRSTQKYCDWLNATLRLPVPFVVFLDPAIDRAMIQLKPQDRLSQVPLDSFEPFRWRARVEDICRTGRHIRTPRDIAFRLPAHPLLMFSKFDMLRRAAELAPQASGLLWVDAGLSRFFSQDLAETQLDAAYVATALSGSSIALSVTPDFARELEQGRMRRDHVGTCLRLVSGGDLYVAREAAAPIARQMFEFIEHQWLDRGLWDNEQVALGYLLMMGIPGARVDSVTWSYANLLERLFHPTRQAPVKRSLGTRLLRLIGIRRP